LALQYSVGIDALPSLDPLPWEAWRIKTANVDTVGIVTANDAAIILQYSAKIINTFPANSKLKSASINNADITIKQEGNKLVFYSSGSLFGLNVFVNSNQDALGIPEVLDKNMISAFNIDVNNYAIGLATAYSPAENTAFMKIPYSKNGNVTFNMIVNTETKSVTVDLTTGFVEFSNANISIYPNPATDNLTISGITKLTIANIYTVNGQLLQTKSLNNSINDISLNNLTNGVYIIKLQADKEIAVKRFVKR